MKNSNYFPVIITLLSLFFVVNVSAQSGKLFTVNDAADTHDATVGDTFCADANGKCTLRAAIEEANANVYQDAINFALPNPSTIDLTIGELVISTNIYIVGPGARKLTVQRSQASGTPQFRIFRVQVSGTSFQPTTIRGMTVTKGNSTGDGGAIYVELNSSLRLADVSITNNTAAGSGGAIINLGTLNISRSLIALNTSNGDLGGGICNVNPGATTTTIINSTLTNNVGGQGGGIYSSGNLILANDTISRNTARTAGSSVFNTKVRSVSVLNTIIGTDNSPTVSSLQGPFVSGGNNLITDARNSTGFTNGTNGDQVSDNNAINPLLGNLADNGGQTDTLALLSGSPAIDHGNNCVFNRGCASPFTSVSLFTDQRQNFLRQSNFGTVDVGAFEFNTFTIGSSFGSIGTFAGRIRTGGALAVFTRATTNEKYYRIIGQTGFATYPTNDRDVYILEIRGKRAGTSSLTIFDLEGGIPFGIPFSSTTEDDGIKFIYEEKSPKKS